MSRLDDATLATLLLTSRLGGGGPPPLKAREFWALVAQVGGDPAGLLAAVPPGAADPDRVQALLDRATAFAFALEDLERSGLTVVSAFDPRYPAALRERLGHQAPPVLHAAGPVALLAQPAVAFVAEADTDPTDAARAIARDRAVAAVRGGAAVLTGGTAGGVDATVTDVAGEADGTVIGLLADALTPRLRHPEVRRAIHAGRLCLATPYPPSAPWSPAAERGRLLVTTALAERTVALDPRARSALDTALADAEARGWPVERVRSDAATDR